MESPQSQYILFPNEIDHKYFALKTQPFYSIFYYTDELEGNRLKISNQVKQKSIGNRVCNNILNKTNIVYKIKNSIPFNFTTNAGKKNLFLLLLVVITTIVIGTITFYYWSYLLGDTVMDPSFRETIENRSIYLSVLFLMMTICLSLLLYEFFTLKASSLQWLKAYQSGQPYNFYDFVMNTRKILLWVFMVIWLMVVLFITIVIAKRPEQFKNLIAVNIMSGIMLLTFQYLYYQTSSRIIKTFCIFISAFIIGFTMFLLYGI